MTAAELESVSDADLLAALRRALADESFGAYGAGHDLRTIFNRYLAEVLEEGE